MVKRKWPAALAKVKGMREELEQVVTDIGSDPGEDVQGSIEMIGDELEALEDNIQKMVDGE